MGTRNTVLREAAAGLLALLDDVGGEYPVFSKLVLDVPQLAVIQTVELFQWPFALRRHINPIERRTGNPDMAAFDQPGKMPKEKREELTKILTTAIGKSKLEFEEAA